MAAKTMLHQSPLGRHFLDRPNMVTLATCGRQPQTLRNGSKLPQYCKKSLETEMLGSNALVSTQCLFVKPAMRTDGGIDRRRHPRLRLSYLLRLLRPGHSTGIQTQTEDLSCDGFYCIADHPVLPQEMVECELLIPGELAGRPSGIWFGFALPGRGRSSRPRSAGAQVRHCLPIGSLYG